MYVLHLLNTTVRRTVQYKKTEKNHGLSPNLVTSASSQPPRLSHWLRSPLHLRLAPASFARFVETRYSSSPQSAATPEEHFTRHGIRWSRRLSARARSEVMLTREKINANRAKIRRHLVLKAGTDSLKDFAFKISVNFALRERGDEARPVILSPSLSK